MVTFSAMLTNIVSTVMIYGYKEIPLWMTWTVTTVYYILTPLMGLVYFLYVMSVIYDRNPIKRWQVGIGLIPGMAYILMVLFNPAGKFLFDINPVQGYTRGNLVFLTYLIFYAYCLASMVVTMKSRKLIDPKIYRILSAFPVLAVLVIIVQQIFPDIILSGSAATCALLIIYLHLQNRQITMDYLTGVPNRRDLLNMLDLRIRRYPDQPFTLLVVSIRDFRQINNACGQQKGDEFLKAICRYLCSLVQEDKVYRFSGDEFAILFTEESDQKIQNYITEILLRMEQPWRVEPYHFQISIVMGVVRKQEVGDNLEHVIDSIEYAVRQAKLGKCGKICHCDKEMLEKLERRQQIIQILKDKMEDKSFEMFYQPIYSVDTGTFLYLESLMRINHSPIGPIYPSEFIPIAEETGMISQITYIILDKVCKFINRLLKEHIPICAVHVNFSAIQFIQPRLPERVMEIIRGNGTPPSAVKIEFTESTLAENPDSVTNFALEMQKHKIVIGLDDFGTGYSNFEMVINIPFDTVKLDKGLVWAAMKNEKSASGVKNIIHAFKELGLTVIAEGVETEDQRRMVIDCGIDQIQGFYYSKPLPEEDAKEFLREKNQISPANEAG